MRIKLTYIFSIVILIIAFLLSVKVGIIQISISEIIEILLSKIGLVDYQDNNNHLYVVWDVRITRALVAILVGSSISIAGAAMQGLFRNPLADPGLIGISSGASLAAALFIVFGVSVGQSASLLNLYSLSIFSFLGACFAAFVVYRFSTKQGKTFVSIMLLMGIAFAAFAESIRGLASFYADEAQLKDLTFWLLGSLSDASWNKVFMLLPFTLIPILFLPLTYKGLNSLALGETNAGLLGVNTNNLKKIIIVLSTMAVGASVSAVGIISFIGLVVPHIVRLIVGPNHKHVMLLCLTFGASLLLIADLICRTIVVPSELPLGVITALIGAPIFISILVNQRRRSLVI